MRRKIVFPSVETADGDGLVAVGGDLEADTLLEAYRRGIFPWPISPHPSTAGVPHTWFSPDPRGLLDFPNLHAPRSFLKFLRHTPFRVTFNQAFREVISQCARTPRRDRAGTWITPAIMSAYVNFFESGHAYSVDVWEEDRLVAGLYGVVIGNFLSGESMFTHRDNASKQGLYALVHHLQERGITWLDTQMVTEVVRQFGGDYVPRRQFLKRLEACDWERPRMTIFPS